jgi:hypothetical protein
MESLIVWNNGDSPVDLSNLFANYRFPKLQRLKATNFVVSSWDHMPSRTGALTNLVLEPADPSHTPTAAELLSIFASNPFLQNIYLFEKEIPKGDDHTPSVVYHFIT